MHWHASPRAAVGFLLHAASLDLGQGRPPPGAHHAGPGGDGRRADRRLRRRSPATRWWPASAASPIRSSRRSWRAGRAISRPSARWSWASRPTPASRTSSAPHRGRAWRQDRVSAASVAPRQHPTARSVRWACRPAQLSLRFALAERRCSPRGEFDHAQIAARTGRRVDPGRGHRCPRGGRGPVAPGAGSATSTSRPRAATAAPASRRRCAQGPRAGSRCGCPAAPGSSAAAAAPTRCGARPSTSGRTAALRAAAATGRAICSASSEPAADLGGPSLGGLHTLRR